MPEAPQRRRRRAWSKRCNAGSPGRERTPRFWQHIAMPPPAKKQRGHLCCKTEMWDWLVAHMIPAAVESIVGSSALPEAKTAACRAGQHSLLWSIEHYQRASAALPAVVARAAEVAVSPDLVAALKASAVPPTCAPTGVAVAGRGYAADLKTARAIWILNHPTTGIEQAFEAKPTAPELVANVFDGTWCKNRFKVVYGAAKHLVAIETQNAAL